MIKWALYTKPLASTCFLFLKKLKPFYYTHTQNSYTYFKHNNKFCQHESREVKRQDHQEVFKFLFLDQVISLVS